MKTRYVFALFMILTAQVFAQDIVQITDSPKKDLDPAVSPDGEYLLFSSNRTGDFNLYLLKFGQNAVMQLTESKGDDRHPAWANDNKTIVFDSKRAGSRDLYQMAREGGTGFLQLTDSDDAEDKACFSPKDKSIVFVAAPKKAMGIHGKGSIKLAADPSQARNATALGEGDAPRISPDGKTILFVSHRTKNNDLWLMGTAGGMASQLTTDPKDDEDPCYSPDGKQIVFASKRTGNFDLYVMNADGSNVRQLTSDAADESQPAWSKGGYIYFVRQLSTTQSNLFRVKAP